MIIILASTGRNRFLDRIHFACELDHRNINVHFFILFFSILMNSNEIMKLRNLLRFVYVWHKWPQWKLKTQPAKSQIKRKYYGERREKKTTDFAFGDIERKCLIVHPQLNTNTQIQALRLATITATHMICIYFRLLTVVHTCRVNCRLFCSTDYSTDVGRTTRTCTNMQTLTHTVATITNICAT